MEVINISTFILSHQDVISSGSIHTTYLQKKLHDHLTEAVNVGVISNSSDLHKTDLLVSALGGMGFIVNDLISCSDKKQLNDLGSTDLLVMLPGVNTTTVELIKQVDLLADYTGVIWGIGSGAEILSDIWFEYDPSTTQLRTHPGINLIKPRVLAGCKSFSADLLSHTVVQQTKSLNRIYAIMPLSDMYITNECIEIFNSFCEIRNGECYPRNVFNKVTVLPKEGLYG